MERGMEKRQLFINIHVGLAAVFLPMLLMMPLTGLFYLFGFKGTQTKTEAFRIVDTVPVDAKAREAFFREQFKLSGVDFDFEYIREGDSGFVFRPSSRVHYVASQAEGGSLIVSKMEPDLLKRLIELHVGHGPILMKWFEKAFGVALILVTLSGLWLALTVSKYRTLTFICFGSGAVAMVFCIL